MELKNNFNVPTRQSYVAIIMILYRIYAKVIKQFWILLIPFFVGRKGSTDYLIYGLIALSVILSIYAIIDFFRYKFHIEGTDLVVEKGVFSKKRIVIPFDRIQSINFKQNIVHQIFNVVGLEIDTAGTSKKEFDFHALNKKTGNELRDYIFANRKMVQSSPEKTNKEDIPYRPIKNIIRLDFFDLVKIGLTQNHLKSLLLALFSLYWLIDQLKNIGINIDKYTKVTEENILNLSLYLLVSLSIFAIIFLIIVSVIRNVLRYYNLVLNRIPNGFKLEYGLFNRNEISVMDNKMQVVKWSDNMLRRALGLFTLHIKLASSVAVKQRKSILIPGVKRKDINKVLSFYFSDDTLSNLSYFRSDRYYVFRRIMIIFIIYAFSIIALFSFAKQGFGMTNDEAKEVLIALSALLGYFILTSILKYRKMKFGINEELLQIDSGIFGNRHSLYTIYKLQGIEITQSPVQIRRNLANLIVFSGAGNETIKYIQKQQAEEIRDYILYKIETDKREWM